MRTESETSSDLDDLHAQYKKVSFGFTSSVRISVRCLVA